MRSLTESWYLDALVVAGVTLLLWTNPRDSNAQPTGGTAGRDLTVDITKAGALPEVPTRTNVAFVVTVSNIRSRASEQRAGQRQYPCGLHLPFWCGMHLQSERRVVHDGPSWRKQPEDVPHLLHRPFDHQRQFSVVHPDSRRRSEQYRGGG